MTQPEPKAPVALLFGGSRGIGAACVCALAAARGVYQADVRRPEEVAAAFDAVERDFGTPAHAVIANAGINVPGAPVAQFDREAFRELLEVNVMGAFHVLAEAGRRVQDGGAIVAVTTSMVRFPVAGAGPYTATKAAVEALLRSMARELAPRRVRVNGVAPGPVGTDLFNAGKTEEAKRRSAAFSPFDRIGTPAEVAQVVRFLVSDEASWMHGQVVQPNGGMV